MIAVEVFQERARVWLEENVPPLSAGRTDGSDPSARMPATAAEVAAAKVHQARLYAAGFAGIAWPQEYGGQGLTRAHERAFSEEASLYDLSLGTLFTIGLGMVGPTILSFGTEDQKCRFVPPLVDGREVWAQLFSEPGAGSDLARLATKATLDGDDWILTGQKLWTSGAQFADFGLILARTSPDKPKHDGMTMFFVDMKAEGVTVRPLRQMSGSSSFSEVFLDGIRVPGSAMLGELDAGWRCAITTLMNERAAIGGGGSSTRRGIEFEMLLSLARDHGRCADPVVRDALARVYTAERLLSWLAVRSRDSAAAGRAPGAEASVAKLAAGRLAMVSANLSAGLVGPQSIAWLEGVPNAALPAKALLGAPAARLAGGTDEIQRNIIGERVLGLPREADPERGVPFRDLI